jgi:hypothetical protein
LNRNAALPNLQILVTLNANLNGTQRLELVNSILNQSLKYNTSYNLTSVQMIIKPGSTDLRKKQTNQN